MKQILFRGRTLPFWILAGVILGLFLLDLHPFETWLKIRQYLLSPPFFYQSLVLYLSALVAALLTYRRLYNVKILLGSLLFLMMGVFSMRYFLGFESPVMTVSALRPNAAVRLLFYLLYSLDILILVVVPSYLPRRLTRFLLTLFVLSDLALLLALPGSLSALLAPYLPRLEGREVAIVLGLNGGIAVVAHLFSHYRRDPYAWSITGLLLLISIAFAVGDHDREVLLLHLIPIALVLLVLANLTASLSHHAYYDPLLNIYNRGYCNDLLRGKSRPLGKRFALALFDLDHFKKVNDRYGHAAGDMVLYHVAQRIREKALPRGITCRYGGEEILVVFPNVSFEVASRIGREIVSSVRQMRIPVGGKKKRIHLRITVSGGMAVGSGGREDPMRVLEAADRALYRAKRLGRNRFNAARPMRGR